MHLTSQKISQKWLLEQIEIELKAFADASSKREWPDIWIVATNIDPSGVPETGAFDRARQLVKKYNSKLAKRFHIWGGAKILDLLKSKRARSVFFGEFVTAGHVIRSLYQLITSTVVPSSDIIRHFVVTEFDTSRYTKLEQAGSDTDNRPSIQEIFTDLPFDVGGGDTGFAASALAKALACPHQIRSEFPETDAWEKWQKDPERARVWFIKGGPGQGKSTITQYIAQIQRAKLILEKNGPAINASQRKLALDIKKRAEKTNLWPLSPRIPVNVELKVFAQWFGERARAQGRRMLAFLADKLSADLGQIVNPTALKQTFSQGKWLFVFDGLDEVPGDIKDAVAEEVVHFVDNQLIAYNSDASIICTSRPQGYSGQFDALDSAVVNLSKLSKVAALTCAKPLLEYNRPTSESYLFIEILREALTSSSVAELMTTPLQSHIMAVIVRDGGKPPERKWMLFNKFYEIIKKREANKNFPDPKLARLLREQDQLIRAVHNRLGFELHRRAETKGGATTSLAREEFEVIVRSVVETLHEKNIDETVQTVMEATTERLVLVNTPESGDSVRFDIRQLQEFFAAEEIYDAGDSTTLFERISIIAGDSHWREVTHFLISALIENKRKPEIAAAVVALRGLDDGEVADTRALTRRLAKGAIVAARLLAEGVLEHDKRVRNQFGPCLQPLMSSQDAFLYLFGVAGEESRSWLIDALLDNIREQAESESIGAAITLTHILPDEDSRVASAKELISGKSLKYRSAVFEHAPWGDPGHEQFPVHGWVSEMSMELLEGERWFELPGHAIRNCVTAVFTSPRGLQIVEDRIGPQFSKIAAAVFGFGAGGRQLRRTKRTNRRRPFFVQYLTRHPNLEFHQWPELLWTELQRSKGIFFGIYLGFKLLSDQDDAAAQRLLAAVGGWGGLASLPSSLRSHFRPAQPASVDVKSADILKDNLDGAEIVVFASGHTPVIDEDWNLLLKEHPFAFMHFLGRSKMTPAIREMLMSGNIVEALPLIASNDYAFSALVYMLGDIDYPLLRAAVVSLIKRSAPDRPTPDQYGIREAPFSLEMPEELVLLPWVAASVSGYAEGLGATMPIR
ncbi:NACHT domain-containing protein [Sinorhizobium prairiense]|uniref:NACHT domain-containing protein n=1 Tax=Sinorhizobium sp. C101 TaxID=2976819 RepID=UPI0023D85194|nr:hypothetical protein [Sinorhizobium sp. C101]WEJ35640.1 hypothetical protein N0R80_00885 [Sinorhizobium sp. C101]